jgi:single-stranded-DNA-specific exonuclease
LGSHCISHVKDVDGVSSAALALAARGGTFRLTDYDELFDELDRVPEGTDSLVLCDLGTDASKFQAFSSKLVALAGRMKVTYIDHHYLSPEMKKNLESLPITLVHDTTECSAMLTFLTLRKELPQEAGYLALYGAVTDYMDNSPTASRMMERFDRQFVLLESTMLAYALAKNSDNNDLLDKIVRELAAMKQPHEIGRVNELALEQLKVVTALPAEVKVQGKTTGKLAYMETLEGSTGNVAKLLLGAFDAVVGASYKRKKDDRVEVSLRATSESKIHLGQTISEIAARHGGNGGGHQRAAGCSLPASELEPVLRELAAKL